MHPGVETELPAMDLKLNGNFIWMEVSEFQEDLLPKPPAHLMPSPEAMVGLKKAFEEMIEKNDKRATNRKMKKEDALADEFVSFSTIAACLSSCVLTCAPGIDR